MVIDMSGLVAKYGKSCILAAWPPSSALRLGDTIGIHTSSFPVHVRFRVVEGDFTARATLLEAAVDQELPGIHAARVKRGNQTTAVPVPFPCAP
jgi:hypothetical protein